MRLSMEAAGTSASSYAFAAFHLGELSRAQGRPGRSGRTTTATRWTPTRPTCRRWPVGPASRLPVATSPPPSATTPRVVQRLPLTEYVVELGELYDATGRPQQAAQQYAVATATARLLAANGVVHRPGDRRVPGRPRVRQPTRWQRPAASWAARQSIHTADALGWALHAAGRDRQALRYVRLATRLGTQDARLLFHRGAVESALGLPGGGRATCAPPTGSTPGPVPAAQAAIERPARRCPVSRLRGAARGSRGRRRRGGRRAARPPPAPTRWATSPSTATAASSCRRDDVTVDHVLDLAEIPSAPAQPSDRHRRRRLAGPEPSSAPGRRRSAWRGPLAPADRRRPARAAGGADLERAEPCPGRPAWRRCGWSAACAPRSAIAAPPRSGWSTAPAGGEVGWREMTARGDGTTLLRSDAPERSRSARLTAYPQDLLSEPAGRRLGAARRCAPAGRGWAPTTRLTRAPRGSLDPRRRPSHAGLRGLARPHRGQPAARAGRPARRARPRRGARRRTRSRQDGDGVLPVRPPATGRCAQPRRSGPP